MTKDFDGDIRWIRRSVRSEPVNHRLSAFLSGARFETRRLVGFGLAIVLSLTVAEIHAVETLTPPPELPAYDEVGVELTSGLITTQLTDLTIGTGASQLSHTIASYGGHFGAVIYGFWDDFIIEKNYQLADHWTVNIGHTSTTFKKVNGVYESVKKEGSTLVDNPNGSITYTSRNGLRVTFQLGGYYQFLYPNGLEVIVHRYTPPGGGASRVQSVTTNTGLQFKWDYASDSPGSGSDNNVRARFYWPTEIKAINNAVEYCSPTAHSCTTSGNWPAVTYDWPTYSQIHGSFGVRGVPNQVKVTDAGGRETIYFQDSFATDLGRIGPVYEPRVTAIKESTSAGPVTKDYEYLHLVNCTIYTCSVVRSNINAYAHRGGATWSYDYSMTSAGSAGYQITFTSTTSTGPHGTMIANTDSYGSWGGASNIRQFLTSVSHYAGNSLRFSQDVVRRVTKATYPGSNWAEFDFDDRGNITMRKDHGDASTTADDVITEAGFDPCTATNFKWCNKPRWTEDAYGRRTDFEYADAHGMVTKVTRPAPKAGAARPQTRYFYQQYYAWYKNSSGSIVPASSPVWLLQKESTCVIGAASGNGCANSKYELTTEYEYGTGSPSRANNLWLRGTVVKAYKNNFTTLETQRTCYQYDAVGNQIAETRPAANLASCN